jgi:hypothetical protein
MSGIFQQARSFARWSVIPPISEPSEARGLIRESTSPWRNDLRVGDPTSSYIPHFVLSRINAKVGVRAFADNCKAGLR